MSKKQKVTCSVQVILLTTTQQYMLYISRSGWFSAVEITEAEAERTSRNFGIEIQKRTVF